VIFVEYDHMVEQLTPNTADEALRSSVLPWASKRWRQLKQGNCEGD
jgi:hypothetical protein